VSGCAGDTPSTFEVLSTCILPSTTFGDCHFTARYSLSNASTIIKNETSGAGVTKNQYTYFLNN